MKSEKKIRDVLLSRLLFSLGIIILIRIGTFLPIPGINHKDLAFYIQRHSTTKTLLSAFSGQNIFVIGLFLLNIFPYINATIFMQLLVGFSPKLAKLQKQGELRNRRKITRLTRIITLIGAFIQSLGISLYLKQVLFNWNYLLALQIIVWLTTGAIIVLWLSELITDYGLGNGTSILIYTNIISNLPTNLKKLQLGVEGNITVLLILIIGILIFITLYGIVFLQEGIKEIPLVSSNQLNNKSVRNRYIDNYYLPLRFNQAGVMPIILTTTALVIPNYIISLKLFSGLTFLTSFKPLYWISYFGLVVFSSSFYSKIVLDPKDISDRLQKMAVTIPGLRPGLQTTFYLKQVIQRLTLIGSIMLATLTVMPNFVESQLNVNNFNGLSITSLLLLTGVLLDLMREISNVYYSNIYNNRY